MLWSGVVNSSALASQHYRLSAPSDLVEDPNGTCFAIDRVCADYVAQNCSSLYAIFCKSNNDTENYVHSMHRFVDWAPEILINDICSFNSIKEINSNIDGGKSKCCGPLRKPIVTHYDQEINTTDTCEKKVMRIWEIQDDCGNRIQSQPQTIHYTINAEFFKFSLDNDTIINCESELHNVAEPVPINVTCDARFVSMNYTDERSTTESSKVVRRWTAKICPGSSRAGLWTGTQIIYISRNFK